ncbi:MAG: ABC transporter ATP-binding protein [Clostridiales bacterium]|nr:ABC transporter ATP-binding protein [Clostridiales bacterium]
MSIIALNNICKRFDEKVIFENFNLEVQEGEFVSIMGASGKGKTTLLNIIGLLERPDSGTVTLCGVKNAKFNSREAREMRRTELSYLFQNYGLMENETVESNLMIAMEYGDYSSNEKKVKISETLEKLGISNFEKRKVYTLSGGEQQRVALAKVMLKDPKLILADEPTGSLDAGNRDFVLSVLKELNDKGKTILVVTHDKNVENYAHTKIVL